MFCRSVWLLDGVDGEGKVRCFVGVLWTIEGRYLLRAPLAVSWQGRASSKMWWSVVEPFDNLYLTGTKGKTEDVGAVGAVGEVYDRAVGVENLQACAAIKGGQRKDAFTIRRKGLKTDKILSCGESTGSWPAAQDASNLPWLPS